MQSFIIKNATEVKTISFDDTAYSDLKPLGLAIKNYSVVMLGEMWHGDGATFEAKSRIIRYLHEKHNFNVVAFESDFYSVTKGFETNTTNREAFDSLVIKNIFSFWAQATQCKPLFEYICSDTTLKICGIDNQLKGELCKYDLKGDLHKLINSFNFLFRKTDYFQKQFWSDFDSSLLVFTKFSWKNKVPYNKSLLKRLAVAIDTIVAQGGVTDNKENNFIKQTLISFRSLCQMFVNLDDFNQASNIRDAQMSNNLEWLINIKYPSEKIIIWLASSHMVKDNQSAYKKPSRQISMGYFYSRNKKNPEAYALGFTSNSGQGYAIDNMQYKIPKTKRQSIERIFKKLEKRYLFVSIKNYDSNRDNTFLFSKVDGGNNIKARWNRSLDGLFYIDKMTPATKK